jgi:putative lipoprotein
MRRVTGFVLASFLLSACGKTPAPAPPSPQAEAPSAVPPGPPVRGELRKLAGGLGFIVCGAPESAAVPLAGKVAEIDDAWKSLATADDGGLYLEVRGTADAARFRVEELVRARPLGEGGSCKQPVFDGDFVIHGNEPFWAIEIRRDGIVYRSPEEPKGRKYPYAATRSAGELFYATRIPGTPGSILEIGLTPKRCIDGMSGEIRSYEALVKLDGRELHGCAAAGVPLGEFGDAPLDELARYAGTYETQGKLWKTEPLQARLASLLGGKLGAFESRFQVSGPLREEGGIFFATGNKRHEGGVDVAAFVADPESDTINVVIVENRKREDFKEGGREVPLPLEVKTLLASLESP